MPTIITHALVGMAGGRLLPAEKRPPRFWVLAVLLPVIPDADVLAFKFGISYGHFLGHRGFFHSLPFALLLALTVTVVFFRDYPIFSRKWLFLTVGFFLLTASHGILDAFTSGGKGIALLAPFDNTRYFFPFAPIQVAPIEISNFFGPWGLRVILSEIIWVWLPTATILAVVNLIRSRQSSKMGHPEHH